MQFVVILSEAKNLGQGVFLECVSKSREMQFREDLTAFQGGFPQVCWRQIKGNQRRNEVQVAENALQAF